MKQDFVPVEIWNLKRNETLVWFWARATEEDLTSVKFDLWSIKWRNVRCSFRRVETFKFNDDERWKFSELHYQGKFNDTLPFKNRTKHIFHLWIKKQSTIDHQRRHWHFSPIEDELLSAFVSFLFKINVLMKGVSSNGRSAMRLTDELSKARRTDLFGIALRFPIEWEHWPKPIRSTRKPLFIATLFLSKDFQFGDRTQLIRQGAFTVDYSSVKFEWQRRYFSIVYRLTIKIICSRRIFRFVSSKEKRLDRETLIEHRSRLASNRNCFSISARTHCPFSILWQKGKKQIDRL